jgi:hypothetical protein
MTKTILTAIAAITVAASAALAQTATTPAPMMPSSAECQAGYKDGMQWTKDQFIKACDEKKQKEVK